MRFKCAFQHIPHDEFYIIVSLGRDTSPFYLTDNQITFYGQPIFIVSKLENDDVVSYYYRNNKKELTLNSNARSKCTGCVFCPNILEIPNDPRIKELDSLVEFAHNVARRNGKKDLSFLEKVTVCTGCFNSEERALGHLRLVRNAFAEVGFTGPLHYLGSVIRSEGALQTISKEIAPFHYTITIECLTRRDKLLRRSKASLDFDGMLELCKLCNKYDIMVDYSYVLGLDPYEQTVEGLRKLAPLMTAFPRINVFQPHNAEMQGYVADGASDMHYFLRVRKALEEAFQGTNLRPRSYHNYRPLWYFKFGSEPMPKVRI